MFLTAFYAVSYTDDLKKWMSIKNESMSSSDNSQCFEGADVSGSFNSSEMLILKLMPFEFVLLLLLLFWSDDCDFSYDDDEEVWLNKYGFFKC